MPDLFDLAGQTALVVGAGAGGLGAYAAQALGGRGAHVLVADLPSRQDDLEQTLAELRGTGVSAAAVAATSPTSGPWPTWSAIPDDWTWLSMRRGSCSANRLPTPAWPSSSG